MILLKTTSLAQGLPYSQTAIKNNPALGQETVKRKGSNCKIEPARTVFLVGV